MRRNRLPAFGFQLAAPAVSLVAAVLVGAGPGASQSPPQRIISVVPAATEMLYAIGARGQIVAVSSFDRFPSEAAGLPRIGGLLDPDVERLLALRPDLVITYATQTDLREQLRRAAIPVFVFQHGGLSSVAATMRALGTRTGHAHEAERAADDVEAELNRVAKLVEGRRRPRTLLVFEREWGTLRNIYASGGTGFLHDMLDRAGGENVYGAVDRESVRASAEQILLSGPDVILEIRAGDTFSLETLERDLASWDALPAVPAVRARRLYALVGGEFVIPGPRVALGARRLASVLHPEAFGR